MSQAYQPAILGRRRGQVALQCRTVLVFAGGPLPQVGDAVPCPAHGSCRVSSARRRLDALAAARPRRRPPRAARRTPEELLEYLEQRSDASLAELRRHRFTLRLVVAAERAGEVEIDWADERARRRR